MNSLDELKKYAAQCNTNELEQVLKMHPSGNKPIPLSEVQAYVGSSHHKARAAVAAAAVAYLGGGPGHYNFRLHLGALFAFYSSLYLEEPNVTPDARAFERLLLECIPEAYDISLNVFKGAVAIGPTKKWWQFWR